MSAFVGLTSMRMENATRALELAIVELRRTLPPELTSMAAIAGAETLITVALGQLDLARADLREVGK